MSQEMKNERHGKFVSLNVLSIYLEPTHNQTFAIDAIKEIIDSSKDSNMFGYANSPAPAIVIQEQPKALAAIYFVLDISYTELVDLITK